MKIFIFGIVASGKTTLARQLSNDLHIQHFEGDCIAWGFSGEKRYKRTDEEQKNIILKINESPSWIVEGTYRKSQHLLFDLADKIIFLDTPLHIRRIRIVTRYLKQVFGIEKSNYQPTFSMLKMMFKWTNDFEKERPNHEKRLLEYQEKLIWVNNANDVKDRL